MLLTKPGASYWDIGQLNSRKPKFCMLLVPALALSTVLRIFIPMANIIGGLSKKFSPRPMGRLRIWVIGIVTLAETET